MNMFAGAIGRDWKIMGADTWRRMYAG